MSKLIEIKRYCIISKGADGEPYDDGSILALYLHDVAGVFMQSLPAEGVFKGKNLWLFPEHKLAQDYINEYREIDDTRDWEVAEVGVQVHV